MPRSWASASRCDRAYLQATGLGGAAGATVTGEVGAAAVGLAAAGEDVGLAGLAWLAGGAVVAGAVAVGAEADGGAVGVGRPPFPPDRQAVSKRHASNSTWTSLIGTQISP